MQQIPFGRAYTILEFMELKFSKESLLQQPKEPYHFELNVLTAEIDGKEVYIHKFGKNSANVFDSKPSWISLIEEQNDLLDCFSSNGIDPYQVKNTLESLERIWLEFDVFSAVGDNIKMQNTKVAAAIATLEDKKIIESLQQLFQVRSKMNDAQIYANSISTANLCSEAKKYNIILGALEARLAAIS